MNFFVLKSLCNQILKNRKTCNIWKYHSAVKILLKKIHFNKKILLTQVVFILSIFKFHWNPVSVIYSAGRGKFILGGQRCPHVPQNKQTKFKLKSNLKITAVVQNFAQVKRDKNSPNWHQKTLHSHLQLEFLHSNPLLFLMSCIYYMLSLCLVATKESFLGKKRWKSFQRRSYYKCGLQKKVLGPEVKSNKVLRFKHRSIYLFIFEKSGCRILQLSAFAFLE